MVDLLTAILNIYNYNNFNLNNYSKTSSNRINQVGDSLEYYIKDAFSNSFNFSNQKTKKMNYADSFSYQGSKNHPPDLILKNSDSFEIKKSESKGNIHLNSSSPKDFLYNDDPRIHTDCRNSDGGKWKKKDIFYIIGYCKSDELNSLFFVHALTFISNKETYLGPWETLQNGISNLTKKYPSLHPKITTELGGIENGDPLKITNLRIRGMWMMDNPFKIFKTQLNHDSNKKFSLFCLLTTKKFETYPKNSISSLKSHKNISVSGLSITDPNNTKKSLDATLIKFEKP